MTGSFFDIENLQKNCIRTLVRRLRADDGFTGKIFSEGCYAMEIRNYSDTIGLNLTINGQAIFLFPALDISGGGGAYLRTGVPQNIILPGQPYLVRSDIIEFEWGQTGADAEFYDAVIIRHMVVPFQEGITYPVYTGKK